MCRCCGGGGRPRPPVVRAAVGSVAIDPPPTCVPSWPSSFRPHDQSCPRSVKASTCAPRITSCLIGWRSSPSMILGLSAVERSPIPSVPSSPLPHANALPSSSTASVVREPHATEASVADRK